MKALGIEGFPCDIKLVGHDAVDAWGKRISFDGGVTEDFGVLEQLTDFTPSTALVRMHTGHLHYVKADQFSKFQPYEPVDENFQRHLNGGCIRTGGDLHREVMTICAAKRKAATLVGCFGFHFKGQYTTKPVEVVFKSRWSNDRDPDAFWTSYEWKELSASTCLLTVHVVEQDENFISVSCTNLGGDEIAAVSVDVSKTVGDLRKAIAEQLEQQEQTFALMTPDGRFLGNGNASLDALE